MNIDKIIAHLEGRISEAEFNQRVERKIEEFGGLLTREGATLIVASELGIPIETGRQDSCDISSIVEGLASVNVVGIVSDIFPIREFSRNNSLGKVANLTLSDKTGSIRTVLWNEDAEKIKDIKRGDILEIIGGYVKKGLYGLELHVGRRGRVITNPTTEKELPILQDKTKKIAELSSENNVNISGVVVRMFGVREFKKDNTAGRVSSLILRDETGEIRVSLWNDKTDISETLKPGDVIKIESGYTKQGLTGLELHVGTRGTVSLSEEKIPISNEEDSSSLRGNTIALSGIVTEIGEVRTFGRADGSAGKVCSLVVKDNDEAKRLILWNEKCDLIPFLTLGSVVGIENAYIREGKEGNEIHVGSAGRVRFQNIEPKREIRTLSGHCDIRGRVASTEPLVISDESGSCEVIAEGTFKHGELLSVNGEYKEGKLFASRVERSEESFPSLENIQNPPRKPITQCNDGDFVVISGFLKKKLEMDDHYRYIIDDGEGEICGIGFEDLMVGKEYVFKVLIREGVMKEFVAYSSEEISDTEALRRMIERIGEMIEV